jgi:hypothetical protein
VFGFADGQIDVPQVGGRRHAGQQAAQTLERVGLQQIEVGVQRRFLAMQQKDNSKKGLWIL